MELEGRVGPVVSSSDGSTEPLRLDRTAALVVTPGHAKYQEACLRGDIFSGSIVGQVTTVGLNTTYTGLCLSNPPGSQANLVLHKVGFSFIVAFGAGAHIGLATGFSNTEVTHTTPVTPRCNLFNGSGAAYGKLDSAATLPVAPTVNQIFGSGLTGAITTVPHISNGFIDLEGSIVLTPGAFCIIYTSTASGAAAGAFSFTWEEVLRQTA